MIPSLMPRQPYIRYALEGTSLIIQSLLRREDMSYNTSLLEPMAEYRFPRETFLNMLVTLGLSLSAPNCIGGYRLWEQKDGQSYVAHVSRDLY